MCLARSRRKLKTLWARHVGSCRRRQVLSSAAGSRRPTGQPGGQNRAFFGKSNNRTLKFHLRCWPSIHTQRASRVTRRSPTVVSFRKGRWERRRARGRSGKRRTRPTVCSSRLFKMPRIATASSSSSQAMPPSSRRASGTSVTGVW